MHPRVSPGLIIIITGGEKVGVYVLSSINSILWPTWPSAHPLRFSLLCCQALWEPDNTFTPSAQAVLVCVRCIWPHPPAIRQTHCSPTHTLYISLPSHVAAGQSQSFALSINFCLLFLRQQMIRFYRCQNDSISSTVWASPLWSLHLNLETVRSRSYYPKQIT